MICTVCEQPGLVCHGPHLSLFLGRSSRQRCALAIALHQCNSRLGILHARNYPSGFDLHEIFEYAYLKFMVYGRKQTYTCTHNFCKINAVTLVWGSLRLAPIACCAGKNGLVLLYLHVFVRQCSFLSVSLNFPHSGQKDEDIYLK